MESNHHRAVKSRMLALRAMNPIWSHRPTCTVRLYLTRGAQRYLLLDGQRWSSTGELHTALFAYKAIAMLSWRVERIGADPRSCTSHLRITNAAFRYQNLAGMNGLHGAS